jgi:hypothetical protein
LPTNDPLYKDQWGLKGHGINLPEAQKFLDTDSGETIVAVIDTGKPMISSFGSEYST